MAIRSPSSGTPVNDGERAAITYFERHLPETFTLFHNIELQTSRSRLAQDFDLIIVSPFDLYAVEVKSFGGTIGGNAARWWTTGGLRLASPVHAICTKAKDLHSWLNEQAPPVNVFVDGIVVLTHPEVSLRIDERDESQAYRIMNLQQAVAYMQDPARVRRYGTRPPRSIALLKHEICAHLGRQYKPLEERKKNEIGGYRLERPLGEGDGYADHLATNVELPTKPLVRLRLYENDPFAPAAERSQRAEEIRRQASALSQLKDAHIPRADNGFVADQGIYAQPLEWIDGPSVRQLLEEGGIASMSRRDRVAIVLGVGKALQHAHEQKIIHRDVRPENIVVPSPPRKVTLTDFDFARIEGLPRTVVHAWVKQSDPRYTAPELARDPSKASPASDQYALGVVLYELLNGVSHERKALSVADLATVQGLSPDEKEVIARMCAPRPEDRFPRWEEALEWMSLL
jgi:hypothetical protein